MALDHDLIILAQERDELGAMVVTYSQPDGRTIQVTFAPGQWDEGALAALAKAIYRPAA